MPKALDDVRVVDLTRVIAGPYATSLLGDMGAQITKIELPGRGDDARYGYPSVDGVPIVFLALNRNKKGITLDVRKPQGAQIFAEDAVRTPDQKGTCIAVIRTKKNGAKGTIQIHYFSFEDFDRILKVLNK